MRRVLLFFVFLIMTLLAATAPASAQPRAFLGGDIFAEIKRFSGNPSNPTFDGTTVGGGIRVGMLAAPRVSIELDVDFGASTTRTTTQPIGILTAVAPIPIGNRPTIFPFQSSARNRLTATSALVGYRPSVNGRIRPEFLGGVTFMHMRSTFETSFGPIPLAAAAAFFGPGVIVPTATIVPITVRPLEQVDNVVAGTVGFGVAIAVGGRFAVVPEVRAHAFSLSNGGPSAFVFRPGTSIRWDF
jgi:hypothetical protein